MPLYAYRCTACGASEEHIQKFSDPPKATCDACGGPLDRLITPTAFHLKGGGWYKDLYASSKPGGGGGGGDSGGSSSGSSSDGGSSGGSSSGGSSSSGSDSGSTAKAATA